MDMSKSSLSDDAWENAVACANAALATSDPRRRALLVYLGEFWLELARHDADALSENIAIDIAMIERVQAKLLGVGGTSH
jgi:hypothetical protein